MIPGGVSTKNEEQEFPAPLFIYQTYMAFFMKFARSVFIFFSDCM
jgi:hypothetical protein